MSALVERLFDVVASGVQGAYPLGSLQSWEGLMPIEMRVQSVVLDLNHQGYPTGRFCAVGICCERMAVAWCDFYALPPQIGYHFA